MNELVFLGFFFFQECSKLKQATTIDKDLQILPRGGGVTVSSSSWAREEDLFFFLLPLECKLLLNISSDCLG